MPGLDFYHHSDRKLFVRIKLNAETLLIGRASECDLQLPSQPDDAPVNDLAEEDTAFDG